MAFADVLKGIGSGLEKGAKVAGEVLAPIGKAVAEEESGQAPQILAERRAHQQKMDDAGIEAQANEIEKQLHMGRQYGTLTGEQQSQLVDRLSRLYAHPSQAPNLMQRIHRIVHPKGATYSQSSPVIPNATPEGGIFAFEQKAKDDAEKRKLENSMQLIQARQDVKPPTVEENFRNDYQKAVESGYTGSPEQWKAEVIARGRAAGAPPHLATPKVGVVNGKSAWGVLSENGWVDPQTKQPIPGFQPAPNYAQMAIPLAEERARAAAHWGLDRVQDPDTGAEVYKTREDVANEARGGNGNVMTGKGSEKAKLALSSQHQITTIQKIVNDHPEMFGPGGGAKQQLTRWLSSGAEDAGRFIAARDYLSEHSAAVFGGRGAYIIKQLNDITNPNQDPSALRGALSQAYDTAGMFINPQASKKSATGAKTLKDAMLPTGAKKVKMKAPNGQTEEVSEDQVEHYKKRGAVEVK